MSADLQMGRDPYGMDARRFEVLLGTYNGERYLSELLDSVLAQSLPNFTILARDDCSLDSTGKILDEYAKRFPKLLTVLPPPAHRAGPCANFAALIAAAQADYIFFCDQDDVWLPDKMAASWAVMEHLISVHGHGCPLLVHTDLTVVGRDLGVLGASMYRYAGIDPTRARFPELLLGNVVAGCTIFANRALYELARPIPTGAVMHDMWFAQVAAGLGHIGFADRPTVLYRQHGENVVGVERRGVRRFLNNLRRTLFGDPTLRVLRNYSGQAQTLLARYGARFNDRQRRQLAALAEVWSLPRHRRYAHLAREGIGKASLARSIGFFILLLRGAARNSSTLQHRAPHDERRHPERADMECTALWPGGRPWSSGVTARERNDEP